jgi:hypothetical protein
MLFERGISLSISLSCSVTAVILFVRGLLPIGLLPRMNPSTSNLSESNEMATRDSCATYSFQMQAEIFPDGAMRKKRKTVQELNRERLEKLTVGARSSEDEKSRERASTETRLAKAQRSCCEWHSAPIRSESGGRACPCFWPYGSRRCVG